MDENTYAVVINTEYYAGAVQHPQGYALRIPERPDDEGRDYRPAVGTLAECRAWMAAMDDRPTCLDHGEASKVTRLTRVVDDDASYQGWLDVLDWDGCPSPDGSDYDANCAWAEERAWRDDGVLPVEGPDGRLYLIDLTI